jgi:hypothetical protein
MYSSKLLVTKYVTFVATVSQKNRPDGGATYRENLNCLDRIYDQRRKKQLSLTRPMFPSLIEYKVYGTSG